MKTASEILELLEEDALPTQSEVEEEFQRQNRSNSNNYDEKCGSCVRWQPPEAASKYGYCKWNGSMVLVFNSICGKYRKSKRWDTKNQPQQKP